MVENRAAARFYLASLAQGRCVLGFYFVKPCGVTLRVTGFTRKFASRISAGPRVLLRKTLRVGIASQFLHRKCFAFAQWLRVKCCAFSASPRVFASRKPCGSLAFGSLHRKCFAFAHWLRVKCYAFSASPRVFASRKPCGSENLRFSSIRTTPSCSGGRKSRCGAILSRFARAKIVQNHRFCSRLTTTVVPFWGLLFKGGLFFHFFHFFKWKKWTLETGTFLCSRFFTFY